MADDLSDELARLAYQSQLIKLALLRARKRIHDLEAQIEVLQMEKAEILRLAIRT